jgi:hypothetical protein
VGERPDGTNPCRHVERYPEKARERLLTPAEVARLGEALDRAAAGWTAEAKADWQRACAAQAEADGTGCQKFSLCAGNGSTLGPE